MSCRSTPAGSAWTTFARLESGLSDVQTLSAFHALRAEGEGVPAPSREEWDRFVSAQRIEMEAAGFTEARVRSITGRMKRSLDQVPDGRSWYALRNIRERSVTESNRVATTIANLANLSGASVEELTTRYEERLRTVERGRSVETPAGYTEARTTWRQAGLPADHGTYTVLTQMRAEADAARADQTPPSRVEHVPFANSTTFHSAGYDPVDGRLEVIFRRRGGVSRTYAYHSVPASVWAEMARPGGSPGVVYNQNVRNHPEYKYATLAEEEAAAHARCEQCGQWRAAAHTCPPVERTDAPVFTPDPVVVSTSRDGRTRLVSVSPEIVEAQQQAAVAAAEAEVVEAFEAYAADTTEEATRAAAERLFEAANRITLADSINGRTDGLTQAERDLLDAEDASRAADLADQAYEAAHRSLAERINDRDDEPGVPHGVDMELDDSYYEDDYYDTDGSKPGVGATTDASTTTLLAGLATSAPPTTSEEVADRDALIADLRARLTGTGSASARVTAVAPEPVNATDLDMNVVSTGRFDHLSQTEQFALGWDDGRFDHLNLPSSMGDLIRAADVRPVVIDAQWRGLRYGPSSTGGTSRQRFHVTGQVTYSRQGLTPTVTGRDLQCTCPDYQNNYDCAHVREAVTVYAATIEAHSAGIGRGVNAETPEIPQGARSALEAGVPMRTERRFHRRRANYEGSADHMVVAPRVTDLRNAAAQAPVIMPVEWTGSRRYDTNGDNFPRGDFRVTGQMIYSRPNSNEHQFIARDLRCTCPAYREDYTCPHVEATVGAYRSRIEPAVGSRGGSRSTAPLTEADIAAAQRDAEEALRQDWTRQEAANAEARARHAAAANPADSYSNNFEAFEADHAAALARKAAGEQVIPYVTQNALGGQFTRESGRGFGVELEFDFPAGVNKYSALAAIGRDLYAAGLTPSASQQPYHAAARRGYTDNHAQGWSFEQDCTVSGEIVSPVMYDEPETWENIAKICEIVARHGGVANAKTGSHVHVGAPNMTTQTASELMQIANSHEDVMYRISQNPARSSHRPMQWCGPNQDVPQGGYTQMHEVTRISSHQRGMNFGGVRGGNSDHPEIRYWDGTMDPAAIQAQIKVSCAMVQAAERNGSMPRPATVRESVGSHHLRLQAVRGRSRRALTSDELAEDTTTFRSFVDTLFTRREDKAQITALFAATSWQRA